MNIKFSSMLNLKSNLLSDSFDFYGFIIYLLFVLLLLYFAYFSTKLIARTYSKVSGGKKIKYLEKCALSMDKAIYLVQIDDEKIYFYADRSTCLILKRTTSEQTLHEEEEHVDGENAAKNFDKKNFLELLKFKKEDSDADKSL